MHHRLRLAAAAAAGSLLAGVLASPADAAEVEQQVTVTASAEALAVDAADTGALEASSCYRGVVAAHLPGTTGVRPDTASAVAERRTATSGPLELVVTAQAWTFTLAGETAPVEAGCLLVDVTYGLADVRPDEPVTLDLEAGARLGATRLRLDEWTLVRAAGARSLDGVPSAAVARSAAFDPAAAAELTTTLAATHGAFADRTVAEGDSYAVSPAEQRAAQRVLLAARLRAHATYVTDVVAADRAYAAARTRLAVVTAKERAARAAVDATAKALQRAQDRAAQAEQEAADTRTELAEAEHQVATRSARSTSEARAAASLERKHRSVRGSRKAADRRAAARYRDQARSHTSLSTAYARSADSWRQRVRELMAELAAWRKALGGRTVEQAQAAHDAAVAAHARVVAEREAAQAAFDEADAGRAAEVDAAAAARDAALQAAQDVHDASVRVQVTAETAGTARVWVTTTVA
jgi:hypothetical protein